MGRGAPPRSANGGGLHTGNETIRAFVFFTNIKMYWIFPRMKITVPFQVYHSSQCQWKSWFSEIFMEVTILQCGGEALGDSEHSFCRYSYTSSPAEHVCNNGKRDGSLLVHSKSLQTKVSNSSLRSSNPWGGVGDSRWAQTWSPQRILDYLGPPKTTIFNSRGWGGMYSRLGGILRFLTRNLCVTDSTHHFCGD